MFENKYDPLVTRASFNSRLLRHLFVTFVLIFIALVGGMIGYHFLESQSWLDAYLNASMILGGMGPVAELKTAWGKIFAGTYALFAGFFILSLFGFIASPILHRALHKFHLDDDDKECDGK